MGGGQAVPGKEAPLPSHRLVIMARKCRRRRPGSEGERRRPASESGHPPEVPLSRALGPPPG